MPVSHSSQTLGEIGLIIFQLSIRTEGRRFELPWSCCAAFAGRGWLGCDSLGKQIQEPWDSVRHE